MFCICPFDVSLTVSCYKTGERYALRNVRETVNVHDASYDTFLEQEKRDETTDKPKNNGNNGDVDDVTVIIIIVIVSVLVFFGLIGIGSYYIITKRYAYVILFK